MSCSIAFVQQGLLNLTASPDGENQGTFLFEPDNLCFQGHFPNNPILPGVVQIMAACMVAAHNTNLVLGRVKRSKFTRVVNPKELVCVAVRLHPQATVTLAKCVLTVESEECAVMTLELIPQDN